MKTPLKIQVFLLLSSLALALPLNAQVQNISSKADINDKRIDESSGLTTSRIQDGILWTHNDSGDINRIFAINTQGDVLATIQVNGATANDWEAISSIGASGKSRIFIGDVGNNPYKVTRRNETTEVYPREFLQIYRIDEPNLDFTKRDQKLSLNADSITLRYPKEGNDTGRHNCEALLALPDERLLLITKHESTSRIYRTPVSFSSGKTQTLELVGSLSFNSLTTGGHSLLVTDASFSRDGQRLAILTYSHVYEWILTKPYDITGLNLQDAIEYALPTSTMPGSSRWLPQCEAVTYSFDSSSLWLTTETKEWGIAKTPLYVLNLPQPKPEKNSATP